MVIPNVKASNGVIHAIDTVLVPPSLSQPPAPTQSIVQIAAGNPDFSTLVSLVQKAGLVEAISAAGPYTVFAPTNEAFAKLAKAAPATYAAVLADPALLAKVLTYHVVAGDINSAQAISVAQQNGTVKPLEGEQISLAERRKANPQRQRHRRNRRHPGDERRDPRNRHGDRPAQPVGLARQPGTQLPAKTASGLASTPEPGCGARPDAALHKYATEDGRRLRGMEERSLRRGNASLAVLHAGQAAVILVLSTDFSLPVTGAFMEAQPGSGVPKQDLLFDLRIGPLVGRRSCCLRRSTMRSPLPPFHTRYERCLATGVNSFRWLEYSLSAPLMVVLIAMLTGIADYVALLALFALDAAMIFFGWLMELLNPPDRAASAGCLLLFGCVVGAVPWVSIAVQIGVSAGRGHAPPGFVYAIFVSLFVLFNSFAVNQALQYKRVGRWRDYRYGERWYLWLTSFAKSLLAWQVFANVLVL